MITSSGGGSPPPALRRLPWNVMTWSASRCTGLSCERSPVLARAISLRDGSATSCPTITRASSPAWRSSAMRYSWRNDGKARCPTASRVPPPSWRDRYRASSSVRRNPAASADLRTARFLAGRLVRIPDTCPTARAGAQLARSTSRRLADVGRQLSVVGSLVCGPRFAAREIGGQVRKLVQDPRGLRPEQHRYHQEVAGAERPVEPLGIPEASGELGEPGANAIFHQRNALRAPRLVPL